MLQYNTHKTELNNVLTTNLILMFIRFAVFLILFSATNASTTCLAYKGSACASSTTCSGVVSGA